MLHLGSVGGRGILGELPALGWREPAADQALDEETARCRDLWLAVLQYALDDANIGRRARAWLSWPSPDRAMVFGLAGIDLDWFVERGLPRLREKWAAIDAGAAHRSIRYDRTRRAA